MVSHNCRANAKKFGTNRNGSQRFRCLTCGKTFTAPQDKPLEGGVFDSDHYFDVFVEYAKNNPEDILVQISACNRGPEAATIHILPTLWFRNTWTGIPDAQRPALAEVTATSGFAL
jgi:hypothetical protein